jgi:DNA polymerase-3 subunit epsilon
MEFVAIDVETANADLASICAVGLVHFRNGEVFRDLSFLIDPEDDFDSVNISIHGIEPEHVRGKPTMRDVLPAMISTLAGNVLAHHTHFDRVAMIRSAKKYGVPELSCRWLDTARVARRSWDWCSKSGYGLANLASEFGITFRHHEACEDAYCCGMVLLRAMTESGLSIEQWLLRCRQPLFADGAKHARAGDPDGPLAGELIVFTGKLDIPRREAAAMAANRGCDVADRVTSETTILVIGDQDVRVLNGKDKSSKHRKAEQMIREGSALRIIGESDFRVLVV